MIDLSIAKRCLLAAGFFALSAASGVASAAIRAYTGTAAAVPGIIQAENFDKGGERVSYHDFTAANTGGRYRLKEGVDIMSSPEIGGGNIVSNFETGEWMVYSIRVATSGYYDVEIRASSAVANGAYHLEVDSRPVTDVVTVPNTGSWNIYQWVGKRRVYLDAGAHNLTATSDQQYFGLDAIRFTAATDTASTPYFGTASAVPGTIEAENYDRGGEGVAYHDTSLGNIGAAYRGEDMDVMASPDPAGGNIVSHFETGEWVAYTINVATAGSYGIETRVASALASSAYHLEIDGQALGRITVPTGAWESYQWIGRQTVTLGVGLHVVKVVSDQPYFGLDAIRFTTGSAAAASGTGSSANLMFRSGFDGGVNINPSTAEECWGAGCWQSITGQDSVSGFNWPTSLWGGGGGKFLLLTDPVVTTPSTIGNYLFNRVDTVTGHNGGSNRALLQQITKNQNGTASMGMSAQQNEFQFTPTRETSDLYVSYWIKFQPDMVQKMNNLPAGPGISGGGTWRAFFAMKTGGQVAWGGPADNGDYRIEAYVMTYGGGQPYWTILGDNNAGGNAPALNSWSVENRNVPVPVGEWFKFELFVHRSAGSDGRVWMAMNGQTLADRRGANVGAWNLPINRVMAPILYSSSAMPIYQWVDDIEIWDGFPPVGNNPPYAMH